MPFFDHMLAQLGKHGGFDLVVRTRGDLEVDAHHTVEDTAIAVGQALREALGDKAGIRRFGDALVPLDETLVQAAVDLSGRPYLVHTEPEIVELIGTYDTTLTRHIWESFTASAQVCLHVRVLAGRNAHHVVEAQFKAVARALRDAVALDPRSRRRPVDQGLAVAVSVQRDPDRASGFLLTVDGTPQSHVDLDDPTYLSFEYVRRMGHVVDLVAEPGDARHRRAPRRRRAHPGPLRRRHPAGLAAARGGGVGRGGRDGAAGAAAGPRREGAGAGGGRPRGAEPDARRVRRPRGARRVRRRPGRRRT